MACDFCNGKERIETRYARLEIKSGDFVKAKHLILKFDKCPPYAQCSARELAIVNHFEINYCPMCGEKIADKKQA